jgi:hypothetical protein
MARHQPDERLEKGPHEHCTRAGVVRAAAGTGVAKVFLEGWMNLPEVVKEPGDLGDIRTAEWFCEPCSQPANRLEMRLQQVPLVVGVRGMGVMAGHGRALSSW